MDELIKTQGTLLLTYSFNTDLEHELKLNYPYFLLCITPIINSAIATAIKNTQNDAITKYLF